MILKGNRVPGVVKEGPIYLNYEMTVRQSNKLVIVFSGVDNYPSRNIASYYGYHNKLNANVLHIFDNFGAHGCYLLSINNDFTIQKLVARLIKKIIAELGLNIDDTFFVGTSKGGTTALFYSFLLQGGNVLAGEPQIKIGDFVYHSGYNDSMLSQSISYTMTGSVEKNQSILNDLVLDCLKKNEKKYGGRTEIIYGSETGYYDKHIRFLEGVNGIELMKFKFSHHNDCIPVFQERILELNEAGWEL